MSDIRSWYSPGGPVEVWMVLASSKVIQPRTRFDWYKLYQKAAFVAMCDAAVWNNHALEIFQIQELSDQGKKTRAESILKYETAARGAAYGYAFRAAELLYDRMS